MEGKKVFCVKMENRDDPHPRIECFFTAEDAAAFAAFITESFKGSDPEFKVVYHGLQDSWQTADAAIAEYKDRYDIESDEEPAAEPAPKSQDTGAPGGAAEKKKLLDVLHPDVMPEIKAKINPRHSAADCFDVLVDHAYSVICMTKFEIEKVPLNQFRVPYFADQLGDGEFSTSLLWAIRWFNERYSMYVCQVNKEENYFYFEEV
jgi:hypothetical protein